MKHDPRLTYEPAEDDTVDPQWSLKDCPSIAIQDCRSYGGGFAVVEHGQDDPEDDSTFWALHHPQEHRTLAAALDAALAIALTKGTAPC